MELFIDSGQVLPAPRSPSGWPQPAAGRPLQGRGAEALAHRPCEPLGEL